MKMKWFLVLFGVIFLSLQAMGTDVYFNLSEFSASPTTNRQVCLVPQTPFVGNTIFLPLTDSNGLTTNLATGTGLYNGWIAAPPGKITFQIYVTATNLGLVDAFTILGTGTASTYPAGAVAWSIAASDGRYGPSTNSMTNFVTNPTLLNSSNVNMLALIGTNSHVQPGSGILTNLTLTGANTNNYVAGSGVTLTTNAGSVTIASAGGGSGSATNVFVVPGTNTTVVTTTVGGLTTNQVSAVSQTNRVVFTNDTTWFDTNGAANARTNGMAQSTGLSAFVPASNFDTNGLAFAQGTNSTNYSFTLAVGLTNFAIAQSTNNFQNGANASGSGAGGAAGQLSAVTGGTGAGASGNGGAGGNMNIGNGGNASGTGVGGTGGTINIARRGAGVVVGGQGTVIVGNLVIDGAATLTGNLANGTNLPVTTGLASGILLTNNPASQITNNALQIVTNIVTTMTNGVASLLSVTNYGIPLTNGMAQSMTNYGSVLTNGLTAASQVGETNKQNLILTTNLITGSSNGMLVVITNVATQFSGQATNAIARDAGFGTNTTILKTLTATNIAAYVITGNPLDISGLNNSLGGGTYEQSGILFSQGSKTGSGTDVANSAIIGSRDSGTGSSNSSSSESVIIAGNRSTNSGISSVAIGAGAIVTNANCFMFSEGASPWFYSKSNYQFLVRAVGGIAFNTNDAGGYAFRVSGNSDFPSGMNVSRQQYFNGGYIALGSSNWITVKGEGEGNYQWKSSGIWTNINLPLWSINLSGTTALLESNTTTIWSSPAGPATNQWTVAASSASTPVSWYAQSNFINGPIIGFVNSTNITYQITNANVASSTVSSTSTNLTSFQFPNTIFVTTNGVDSNAVVGNVTKPFLTLTSAFSHATSGMKVQSSGQFVMTNGTTFIIPTNVVWDGGGVTTVIDLNTNNNSTVAESIRVSDYDRITGVSFSSPFTNAVQNTSFQATLGNTFTNASNVEIDHCIFNCVQGIYFSGSSTTTFTNLSIHENNGMFSFRGFEINTALAGVNYYQNTIKLYTNSLTLGTDLYYGITFGACATNSYAILMDNTFAQPPFALLGSSGNVICHSISVSAHNSAGTGIDIGVIGNNFINAQGSEMIRIHQSPFARTFYMGNIGLPLDNIRPGASSSQSKVMGLFFQTTSNGLQVEGPIKFYTQSVSSSNLFNTEFDILSGVAYGKASGLTNFLLLTITNAPSFLTNGNTNTITAAGEIHVLCLATNNSLVTLTNVTTGEYALGGSITGPSSTNAVNLYLHAKSGDLVCLTNSQAGGINFIGSWFNAPQ